MSAGRIVIIGGGLAGLAAATFAARAGATVTVLERSHQLGGRASTRSRNGFLFNQGAHALYQGGTADRVLSELGIEYSAGNPSIGGVTLRAGRLYQMPAGLKSLLTTRLLSPAAKLEVGAFMTQLYRFDPAQFDGVSIREFVDTHLKSPVARGLIDGLMRVSSYSNAPQVFSAGAVLRQLQVRLPVAYLDGGWQTLVDGLEAAATEAGVEICTGARVEEVRHDSSVHEVAISSGPALPADAVIITGAPGLVADLAPRLPAPAEWAASAEPARIACLDLGLSKLPMPKRPFAISTDQPLYYSVHSNSARLTPEGMAMVSLARYIPAGETQDAAADLHELEAYMDLLQPGWREFEVERQYLPSMRAHTAVPLASAGGLSGRPGVAIPGVSGLFVAGDWVGPEGILADAVMASARSAAMAAVEASSRTLARAS